MIFNCRNWRAAASSNGFYQGSCVNITCTQTSREVRRAGWHLPFLLLIYFPTILLSIFLPSAALAVLTFTVIRISAGLKV